MRTSSPTERRRRAVESFGNAATAIGPIEHGMSLFAITRGQWSMIDAILYCLDEVGPSEVSIWTWTVAEYEIQTLNRLRRDERITAGRMVIDGGARAKNADIIREWKQSFGPSSVRYVHNHAKIATITSASGFRLLLRGSMNLNFNPRFEQFDLTEGGEDFELVRRTEDDLPILEDDATGKQIWTATGAAGAFPGKTLHLFGKLQTWAK
jgi:hypothetical protein